MRQETLNISSGIKQNKFFVYELDGVLRAAQTTKKSAMKYMKDDRLLIYKTMNGIVVETTKGLIKITRR